MIEQSASEKLAIELQVKERQAIEQQVGVIKNIEEKEIKFEKEGYGHMFKVLIYYTAGGNVLAIRSESCNCFSQPVDDEDYTYDSLVFFKVFSVKAQAETDFFVCGDKLEPLTFLL